MLSKNKQEKIDLTQPKQLQTPVENRRIFNSTLKRLIQSQHLQQVDAEAIESNNTGRLQYILHYIQQSLTSKIIIGDLCKKVHLSRNAFFKWFREQFGLTPLDYINNERVRLAKKLLADKRYSISQISAYCGFSDVNYFVRLFKKTEGITPGAYKGCMMQ